MNPWYAPAPGTRAHAFRSVVRAGFWSVAVVIPASVTPLFIDPSTRPAVLHLLGL